jgi:cation-transporting ATPase E
MIIDQDLRVVTDTYNMEASKTMIVDEVIRCFKTGTSVHMVSGRFIEVAVPIQRVKDESTGATETLGVILVSASLDSITDNREVLSDSVSLILTITFIVMILIASILSFVFVHPFKRLTRKLSAVTFNGLGTYILGAPEFVLPNMKDGKVKDMIEQYAKDGYRVLVLANCSGQISNDNLPSTNRSPVAVIVLEDRIREDAIETIKWFKENDVKIKIISGDNPLTVAEIAKRVGVTDTESFINLEGLSNSQVIQAANKYTVFGRVTPEQKAILVKAMKAQGNTVAMTGDGVNDILALKEADCSIAMASGSEAVRSVSHMVLLDSKFSSMPQAVFEGRRVINNIQKSSALFFMKTIFTVLFSVFILATSQVYPFSPSQMYMLEFFVIGVPSFFLALQPNKNRIQGRFIYNLFKNSTPGALTLFINTVAIYLFVLFTQGTWDDTILISSMATLAVTFTGIVMLFKLCNPMNVINGILCTTMTAICFGLSMFASDFFEITTIGLQNMLFLIILILISGYIISICAKIFEKIKIGGPPQPKISAWVDQQYSQQQERKD